VAERRRSAEKGGAMSDKPGPFAGWTKRDWIAFVICLGLGISLTESVGQAIRPPLDFWPAFAIKVAAGGIAVIVAWVIWGRLIRPRL
jgi:hypothetical protein